MTVIERGAKFEQHACEQHADKLPDTTSVRAVMALAPRDEPRNKSLHEDALVDVVHLREFLNSRGWATLPGESAVATAQRVIDHLSERVAVLERPPEPGESP